MQTKQIFFLRNNFANTIISYDSSIGYWQGGYMYENIHKIHATQCEMEKWQKTLRNTRQCPLDTNYPLVNLPYVLYFGRFSATLPFMCTVTLFPLCYNQSLWFFKSFTSVLSSNYILDCIVQEPSVNWVFFQPTISQPPHSYCIGVFLLID